MRFMHMADTHLGVVPYNLEERENDIYEGFEKLIDRAIEERVDFIIHSGDFFNRYRPSNLARKVVMDQMRRLEDKGIKVFAVLGDHDIPKRKDKSALVLYPNIKILGIDYERELPQIIEYKGATIMGIPSIQSAHRIKFLHKILENTDKFLSDGKRKNVILVLHQAIKEFFKIEGQYQLELGHLPKNVDYYALGHLHDRNYRKFGRGILAYAGSTDILRKSEVEGWEKNGKGAYIVDISDEVEITPVNLDIRPHLLLEVSSSNDIEKLLKEKKFEKKPVIYVTLNVEKEARKEEVIRMENLLRDIALKYEISINRKEGSEDDGIKDIGHLNLKEIMLKYYKDEKLTELSYELFGILRDMKEKDMENGIPKEILEVLREHYGGDAL